MRPWVLALLVGCRGPTGKLPSDRDTAPETGALAPLIARPELRQVALERREVPPFDAVWQAIVDKSEEELRDPDPATWDHSAHGHNARVAQAAATRAWLDGDADAAEKARLALDRLDADLARSDDWDLNIRLPRAVTCSANAVELLQASGFASDDEAAVWNGVIADIGEEAYARFVLDDAMRQIALGFSQNNHPLRTASAIGYAALADLDAPGATERLDWALSEFDYLLGPDGQYIQPDGVVSEGPHYYAFGLGAVLSFLVGVDHRLPAARWAVRDCANRQDVDPWAGHGCVDGEEFEFSNPLRDPTFQATADWSVSQRLPTGHRPPRADSYLVSVNGLPLLTHYGAPDHLMWDWLDNADAPLELGKGMDLSLQHLLLADGDVGSGPPAWTHAVHPAGGEATFRSGWDADARWMMLAAENGAARKTLHDHVDGTSFQVAAYGDYLLMDTGYHKPQDLDNAKTAHAPSHNVLLIDGEGAPDKGLLTNWGDADAFLENDAISDDVAWAEARMAFARAELVRGGALVRGRYFVVADAVATDVAEDREHRFRLHLNAGFDAGGQWWMGEDGPGLSRDSGALQVSIGSTAGEVRFEEPEHTPLQAPHVHLFDGDREPRDHAVVDAVVDARAPGFLAVMAPWRVGEEGADGPLDVQAVDAGVGGVAWRVRGLDAAGAAFDDLLWAREASASDTLEVGGQVVVTDARFVWLSLDGSGGLVARGTEVRLAGESHPVDALTGAAAF